MTRFQNFSKVFYVVLLFTIISCTDDDQGTNQLNVPDSYVSENYIQNSATEGSVIDELNRLTALLNSAEANAQSQSVAAIDYPTTLSSITVSDYKNLTADWLVELVKSANSPDRFINPGFESSPDGNDQGGLLGTRLLDEYGLELEQMIEKGAFGAALYNHAITVVNSIKNGEEGFTDSGAIDRLVEIHGAQPTFDVSQTTAAATYSRRRSNLDAQKGFFFDIKNNLITAKAAMEAGASFNNLRDEALDAFLLNWEKSNFATVIFYCKSTKDQLTSALALGDGEAKNVALGNAMHAYAEGVAFAHGFKRASVKMISDIDIDYILNKLLAPEAELPQSHRFLNEISLFNDLDTIIADIQAVYGFTNEEVESFYVNNNL